MRIVHVTSKWGCVRTRRAARLQRDQGHEVVLVMGAEYLADEKTLIRPTWKDDDEKEHEMFVDGFETHKLNRRHANNARSEVIALDPDLVFAHELDNLFLMTALWTKDVDEEMIDGEPMHRAGFEFESLPVPLIYDSHEYERGRPYMWKTLQTDTIRAWQEKSAIAYADHVITPSWSMSARLRADYMLAEYPTVVLNSPPRPVRPVDRDRDEIRERLKLGANDKALGFAGYITQDRMLRQLIRAYGELGKGWRLFIMGKTGADPALELELSLHGATFLGELPYPWPESQEEGHTLYDGISAMDVVFGGSDVFAYPNWKLGAPNKVFEYLIAGVPQVISDAIDPALIMDDHLAGIVYDNTISGLVDAIQAAEVLTVDSEKMAELYAYETQREKLDNACELAMRRHRERSQSAA